MRQFPEISESFRGFIEKQGIFFVGAAGPDWISHRRDAEGAEERVFLQKISSELCELCDSAVKKSARTGAWTIDRKAWSRVWLTQKFAVE
jgi:hypothetical protein